MLLSLPQNTAGCNRLFLPPSWRGYFTMELCDDKKWCWKSITTQRDIRNCHRPLLIIPHRIKVIVSLSRASFFFCDLQPQREFLQKRNTTEQQIWEPCHLTENVWLRMLFFFKCIFQPLSLKLLNSFRNLFCQLPWGQVWNTGLLNVCHKK